MDRPLMQLHRDSKLYSREMRTSIYDQGSFLAALWVEANSGGGVSDWFDYLVIAKIAFVLSAIGLAAVACLTEILKLFKLSGWEFPLDPGEIIAHGSVNWRER